jgi:hypothetical protein
MSPAHLGGARSRRDGGATARVGVWHDKGGTAVAVMEQYRAHFTGAWVAQCHACGTVCVSWDADDLNDAGDLVCGCQAVE